MFIAEHAAAATVGEGELAEEGFVRGDSGAGGWGKFHGDSGRREIALGRGDGRDPSPGFCVSVANKGF